MKKVLLALSALMVAVPAFAQYFPARAYVTVLPGQVTAEIFNPYYEPIICNGEVFGQTVAGPVFHSFFYEQLLPAGGYRSALVRADLRNPFVHGWANIHCRFIR